MPISADLKNEIANFMANATPLPSYGGGRFVGLFRNTTPSPTECTGTGYARVESASKFPDATNGSGILTNTGTIEWPVTAADWTPGAAGEGITIAGLFDAATGGKLIATYVLKDAANNDLLIKITNTAMTITFPPGSITFTIE